MERLASYECPTEKGKHFDPFPEEESSTESESMESIESENPQPYY
jgi:hypothetical protein